VTKDMTQGSQTVPSEQAMPETEPASTGNKTGSEPVVASAGEQEKQRHEDAQAAMPAPATDSQAPVSTLPRSDEKAPLTTSPDSGPEPVNEKATPTMTTGGPPEPGTSAFNRQLDSEFEHRRLQKHTRLARFFTWLLLLGFVILPSTFGKSRKPSNADIQGLLKNQNDANQQDIIDACVNFIDDNRNRIGNTPLFPIGYVCCILNLLATVRLWRLNSDDYKWLYTNLFFAGLTNAFSGLITTLASAYGAHGGFHSPAEKTTLAFALICTIIYGMLAFIYGRRIRLRRRRGSTSITA